MTFHRQSWRRLILAAALLGAAGCANHGKVEQGRTVAFDKQNGVVTLILDSAPQANQPEYDRLPPVKVKLPVDPDEIGPLPEPGKLLLLDTDKHQMMFFDPRLAAIKSVSYTIVEQHDNVGKDDARLANLKLPLVDRQQKTVTIYSRRKKILLRFTVPDKYLALPDDTWKAGDEVRYYCKQPDQALRLMNVSKTDLTKEMK
jgi:hypothetical protein